MLSWRGRALYLLCAATVLIVTALVSRRGLKQSLDRPIVSGFGPPCSLWQAWKSFCSFFWEQILLVGVLVSCSVRLWLWNFHWVDLAIAVGVAIAFPFQEYFSHRLLLHRPPIKILGREYESTIALVHRVHHRDPWHMERAINPPIAVMLYAVGLPIVFFPFCEPSQAMTGVAASWVVFLVYEWNHFLVHTSHKPRNWLFRKIWRNHRLHHFKNEHFWFNVSTYGVDLLLGTQPEPNQIRTSPTCLTLDEREAQQPESVRRAPRPRVGESVAGARDATS